MQNKLLREALLDHKDYFTSFPIYFESFACNENVLSKFLLFNITFHIKNIQWNPPRLISFDFLYVKLDFLVTENKFSSHS